MLVPGDCSNQSYVVLVLNLPCRVSFYGVNGRSPSRMEKRRVRQSKSGKSCVHTDFLHPHRPPTTPALITCSHHPFITLSPNRAHVYSHSTACNHLIQAILHVYDVYKKNEENTLDDRSLDDVAFMVNQLLLLYPILL